MIKLIAIGVWVCIATLASGYVVAGMRSEADAATPKDPTYFAGLDYRKTDAMTVPIILDHAVQGYVLARFVYTIDGEIVGGLAVPPDPFIIDEAFRAIYVAKSFRTDKPEQYDLPALTAAIKDAVNARYGKEVVHEVLIEQFDYLPKNAVGASGGAAPPA